MSEMRKFVAPEFIFGVGAIELASRYVKNFGSSKPLIVSDSGVIAAGWVPNLIEILESEDISPRIYSEISANPRDFEVMEGADYYLSNDCDMVIGIGGGSPMDAAKAIGAVASNRLNVLEFEGIDSVPFPGPPLLCIPTTAGTSADVSQFSIINDVANKRKFAIISKTMVPDIALIDPSTCLTMDNYLTACTGIDALVHAIEAVVSTANSPIMDLHALEAIRLIDRYLLKALAEPDNMEYRTKMMLGSLEAGLAFSNASLGAVHAMAHSLGGYLDLPHGECNALLLDAVIRYNYSDDYSIERYRLVADALELEVGLMNSKELLNAITSKIIELRKSAGISASFSERGLSISDIPILAKNAVKDPCMVTNPRRPNQRDIEVVYEECL